MNVVAPDKFIRFGTWKQHFRSLRNLYERDEDVLEDSRVSDWLTQFESWRQECEALGLSVSSDAARTVVAKLKQPPAHFFDVERDADHFFRSYEVEINKSVFLEINEHSQRFLGSLLTSDFVDRYSTTDIEYDLFEVESCMAFERSTAAVFHLMRVVEHGLRDWARRLPAEFAKPELTVDDADWHQLLDGIDRTIKKMRGHAKREALEECDYLYLQFNAFKNAFRNPVSHLRGKWTPEEAEKILNAVKAFMDRAVKWSEA